MMRAKEHTYCKRKSIYAFIKDYSQGIEACLNAIATLRDNHVVLFGCVTLYYLWLYLLKRILFKNIS